MKSIKTSELLEIFLVIVLKIHIISTEAFEIDKEPANTKFERFCSIQFKESLNYCDINKEKCWATDTTSYTANLPPQIKLCSSPQTAKYKEPASVEYVAESNPIRSASMQVISLYTHEFKL